MNIFLLTVKMADNGGRTVDQTWSCATREKCFSVLQKWVEEQIAALYFDDSDEDVESYFATSEDTYEIDEMEVLA